MDYRICGELRKFLRINPCYTLMSFLKIVERNKALDEFAMSQDAAGVIQVRI